MLLLLCCLGALATCGLGFSPKDKDKLSLLDKDIEQGKPLDDTFASFKAIFHKKYKDDKEHTKRKKIFEDNAKLIKNINKKHKEGKLTYYAGVNEFADLTQEEFLNYYTGLLPNETTPTRRDSRLFRRRRSLPNTKDWRNEGFVTEVKNQGACKSCWTFSSTGSLEGQYKKKTGQLISFSEQQLLECRGNTCNYGGAMWKAFYYVMENGIEGAEDYPYVLPESTCKYNKTLVKAYLTDFQFVPQNEEALAQAVAEVGPISCAVDASHLSFYLYKGGVFDEPTCSSDRLTHGMLVVGYGTSDGQDYWLVKNSWGTSWGMDGYIQMSRNKNNQCGIATGALYPLM